MVSVPHRSLLVVNVLEAQRVTVTAAKVATMDDEGRRGGDEDEE